MKDNQLNWGIVGTGRIAGRFAEGVKQSHSGNLVAVGSRQQESAQKFANQHAIPVAHTGYDALLNDSKVDAVYISTPNHLHAPLSIQAAQAGKHVLCEKPMAMNQQEARGVIDTVKEADVFFMEAFMYRCHPQIAKLVELIREQAIGTVRHIRATFGYDYGPRADDIRNVNAWGGGGIMDIGCYCLSGSRLIAGAATGKHVAEPLDISATAIIPSDSNVDQWSAAAVKFPDDITADLLCGMQLKVGSMLQVFGSEGCLTIPNPWLPLPEENSLQIRRYKPGAETEEQEEVIITSTNDLYALEADMVADHVSDRSAPPPCAGWDDSIGNMRALDMWRESVGLNWEESIAADRLETRK